MNTIKAQKGGKKIRVIAPVRSLGLISKESREIATSSLEKEDFSVSFGKNVEEMDEFASSSIGSRIEDLNSAFLDKDVDIILSVIGGYNSNQLLNYIDYEMIKQNPKVISGFSDMTALLNAITVKTGLITYVGPHYSSWGMKKGFEYTKEYFIKTCLNNNPFNIERSKEWSDDPWFMDQENRDFIKNDGPWILNEGSAAGKIFGGHLRCFNALQGTEYFPDLEDTILFVEEDDEINPQLFDRELQSIIHQKDFAGVKAILIGRFQKGTKMTKEKLLKIIKTKKELNNMPVIANMDFGHTTPMLTIPIGGTAALDASGSNFSLKILDF